MFCGLKKWDKSVRVASRNLKVKNVMKIHEIYFKVMS